MRRRGNVERHCCGLEQELRSDEYRVLWSYFFQPIAAADSPGEPLLPAAVGFLVYVVLSVFLLDWVTQKVGDPVRQSKAGVLLQSRL